MKRSLVFLPLFIVISFTPGCQDQQALADLENLNARAAVEELNAALITKLVDELNNRNENIYRELCSPEYLWHFPANNPDPLSRDQEMEFVKLIWKGFPDIKWSIEEIIAADEKVVIRFLAQGTHEGEYLGMPPTGNAMEASGIIIYRIADGKITESREDADIVGMMEDLGMELAPAAVGD